MVAEIGLAIRRIASQVCTIRVDERAWMSSEGRTMRINNAGLAAIGVTTAAVGILAAIMLTMSAVAATGLARPSARCWQRRRRRFRATPRSVGTSWSSSRKTPPGHSAPITRAPLPPGAGIASASSTACSRTSPPTDPLIGRTDGYSTSAARSHVRGASSSGVCEDSRWNRRNVRKIRGACSRTELRCLV